MGQTINCKCGNPVASAKSTRCAKCRRAYQNGARHRWKKPPPEYWVWRTMISRCENQKDKAFPNYGARGISVCAQWRGSFESFARDMMPRPLGGTIERINNNGNYEPGNCTWTSRANQQRNRRNNVVISFAGRTMVLEDWARDPICVVTASALSGRYKRGWDFLEAMTTPSKR